MRDPGYKTVCDYCSRGTWYDTEQGCHMSVPTFCKCCGSNTGDKPCPGTLRVIDRSMLAPQFAGYHGTDQRVRVRFSYGEELTGTIGITTGWRPVYLLMRRSSDTGSMYTLSDSDQVVAVQRGRKYVAVTA